MSIRRLSTRWFLVCIIAVAVLDSLVFVRIGDSWWLLVEVPLIAVGVGMLVRERAATRRR